MSGKIDFSRPYGQVYGEASHHYEQDGKRFDAQGNEVAQDEPAAPAQVEGEPEVDQAAPKRKYARRAAPAAETSPVDAELAVQLQG